MKEFVMSTQTKKYQVVSRIILDFLGPREQFGKYFFPEDNVILEADDCTIWVVHQDGKKEETINMVQTIELYIEKGLIEEVES